MTDNKEIFENIYNKNYGIMVIKIYHCPVQVHH